MIFAKLLIDARLAQAEHDVPPLSLAMQIVMFGWSEVALGPCGMDFVSRLLRKSSPALDAKSERKYCSRTVKLVRALSPNGSITRTQKLLAEGK